ncbi:MAG TPA: DNA-formamidopyrimidine glycosylase family protein [Polyangia bacterium]|jgi:formamidopyrimidine-DNA glycosylase|nr:DNA-formamidopyrimidine glycosylase family protein [Polyangia bacterium]
MPELPDLVHVEKVLSAALSGRTVVAARVGDPTVLRLMLPGDLPTALVGQVVRTVERRGHFMRFGFDGDLVLVVNAMLVGKYRLLPPAAREKDPVALGFALHFDDGSELRYLDDKRMGKVYVARVADEATIPVYAALGVDLLSPDFTRERFLKLARGRRDQARMFLMDKAALASIGNAYADEILFAARIHPKTFMRSLTDEDLDRLFVSVNGVLSAAIHEITTRNEPPDVKIRDFLAVRGRVGQPCPRCGTKIRDVRVGDGDACFCPTCQPATRSLFVDWSRVPAPDVPSAAAAAAPKRKRKPARRG